MSKPRRDFNYLTDIEEAIQRILVYTKNMDVEEFLANSLVQDAVLRNFQVLGEATKNLSEELRTHHAELPWREMAGMRDKIVHDYIGVNYRTIWNTIQQDLPPLLSRITSLLDEMEK